MKEKLKDLLNDYSLVYDNIYYSNRFDCFNDLNTDFLDIDDKKEIFEYQLKIFNELGVYIPYSVVSCFVYYSNTQYDCSWCSSNLSYFGTIDKFQEFLILILEDEFIDPQNAFDKVMYK